MSTVRLGDSVGVPCVDYEDTERDIDTDREGEWGMRQRDKQKDRQTDKQTDNVWCVCVCVCVCVCE